MRVLIISDSHGKTDEIGRLKAKEGRFDLIIHCGDGNGDFNYISDVFDCKVIGVKGNCDLFSSEPKALNHVIEGKVIHIEHGNALPIYSDLSLLSFAEDNGYDVVLYGHTHIQKMLSQNGRFVVNPGSISRPRDGYPSYTVLKTDGRGGFSFENKRM